jgi:Heterokaryon incompatibility protein (HET)
MTFQPHGSRRPYRPLPDPKTWIRLMQVTRNQSGTICCTLHAFKVSELAPESFCALSYEWGPPRDLVEIQVDGCPLQIRPSLAAFLAKIIDKKGDPDVLFFADAICIDQENIVERDAQVLLMGWIFNNASATHCWLGEAANGIDELLEMLYVSSLALKEFWKDVKSMDVLEARTKLGEVVRQEYVRVFGTLDRLLLWDAVTAFLKRSYWSRVWMQQEILLANKLLFWCADNIFPGGVIEGMLEYCEDVRKFSVYNGWSIFSQDYSYQLSQREIDENN